jgi:hypothetical protein
LIKDRFGFIAWFGGGEVASYNSSVPFLSLIPTEGRRSPSSPASVGLKEAGTQLTIDLANSPSFEDEAVLVRGPSGRGVVAADFLQGSPPPGMTIMACPATFGRFPRRAGTIPQKSGRREDLAGSLAGEDTMSRPDQLWQQVRWQQVRPPVRRL